MASMTLPGHVVLEADLRLRDFHNVAFRSAKGFLLSDGPLAERKATMGDKLSLKGFHKSPFVERLGAKDNGRQTRLRDFRNVAFRSAKGFLLSDGPFAERKTMGDRPAAGKRSMAEWLWDGLAIRPTLNLLLTVAHASDDQEMCGSNLRSRDRSGQPAAFDATPGRFSGPRGRKWRR